jgi:hypothetical protein
MFVDWLTVDGFSMHHPPKNLGESCLNMFYYGALCTADKIFSELGEEAMACKYRAEAERLKCAINTHLYHEDVGLYCEGLTTPTPEDNLTRWKPQSNGKLYFRKHANILAAYFGVCDKECAREILRRVFTDDSLGDCQPYFMHFGLDAIYRNGLREEWTLKLLEPWCEAAERCPKGLQEGFISPPGTYAFDLSHAWGGTPLYALPRALMGVELLEPAFRRIKLSPSLLGLESATVELPTPYGKIVCRMVKGRAPEIIAPNEIEIIM